MRDASVEPSQEAMLDDPIPSHGNSAEDLQLDDEDLLQDDDMLDEDTVIHNPETNAEDLPMEAHLVTQLDSEIEDDEILYDDEEFAQEANTEDQSIQEPDIDNEEDLFHDDEVIEEHEMEELGGEQQETNDNHIEDVFLEEPHANITIQDPEHTEALQESGPLESLKENSDYHTAEHSIQHEDELHHEFNNEEQTDTLPASESATTGAVITYTETTEVQRAPNPPGAEELERLAVVAPTLTETATEGVVSDSPAHEEVALQHGGLEAELHTKQEGEAQQSEHPTLLHTVKVNYQDNEICLFPPTDDDESEMFFLSDVSLAHQGLDKLLCACRDVLVGAIEDDDELVLDVASLGLHISEVCGSRHPGYVSRC